MSKLAVALAPNVLRGSTFRILFYLKKKKKSCDIITASGEQGWVLVGGVYKVLRNQLAGVAGVCAVSAQGFASRDCVKYMKMRVF